MKEQAGDLKRRKEKEEGSRRGERRENGEAGRNQEKEDIGERERKIGGRGRGGAEGQVKRRRRR